MVASEQHSNEDSAPCRIRRQVSDLGMEDPVVETRRRRRKPASGEDETKRKIDGDSAVSTCCGNTENIGDEEASLSHTLENDSKDDNQAANLVLEDDTELDFDDLMSMSTRRSGISRSSSAASKRGSMTLRAMSDSFTNGSFNSSGTGSGHLESSMADFQASLSEELQDGRNQGDASPVASGVSSSPPCRRKLPQRTGSGYVRGPQRTESDSSVRRANHRASVIKKSSNGVVVSGAALREKRRMSNLNASFTQMNASVSQLRK